MKSCQTPYRPDIISSREFPAITKICFICRFLYIEPSLERKAKRNLLTGSAASSYMFTSCEISDDNGVLLGINRYNNSFCIIDFFDTKKHKNGNLNFIGHVIKSAVHMSKLPPVPHTVSMSWKSGIPCRL